MRYFRTCLVGIALMAAGSAAAQDAPAQGEDRFGIFDELRLGGSFSIQGSSPDGVLVNGQLLFSPFVAPRGNYLFDTFLRPRPHVGVTVATDGGTSQVFGGLAWNFPLVRPLFLEASFGGTVHDGPIHARFEGGEHPGCRFLFRESAGLGLDLGPHWRVIAAVDHSSHAELCSDDNGGLTHAGISVGYRF